MTTSTTSQPRAPHTWPRQVRVKLDQRKVMVNPEGAPLPTCHIRAAREPPSTCKLNIRLHSSSTARTGSSLLPVAVLPSLGLVPSSSSSSSSSDLAPLCSLNILPAAMSACTASAWEFERIKICGRAMSRTSRRDRGSGRTDQSRER